MPDRDEGVIQQGDTGVQQFSFRRIETPAAKWTFDPEPVRRYVERWLEGTVLNLFAGQTELRHDGDIHRNDCDESIDADTHFDAVDVAAQFGPRSLDTVILDPPYNVRKAREKYDGQMVGTFTHVKDELIPLVRPGGRTIHFGYSSTGMGRKRGFDLKEICLLNHKGDINDTIVVVEQRVEHRLGDFSEQNG